MWLVLYPKVSLSFRPHVWPVSAMPRLADLSGIGWMQIEVCWLDKWFELCCIVIGGKIEFNIDELIKFILFEADSLNVAVIEVSIGNDIDLGGGADDDEMNAVPKFMIFEFDWEEEE
ncbi:unnamed protein product [Protopolystoma xenopodis]|uniref:Uncharacterized protein n=1 Tax=Protopolystoma xenopodis TaxID=117903 RepID=A0A448X339_9PLAT|nr:unnamed protein product [Protopolystoma xenopodis]